MNQRTNFRSGHRMVAGAAAVAIAGVAIATASATADPDANREWGTQSVSALLARGTTLTPSQIVGLKTSPAVTSNNGDLSRARAIAAPPGAAKSSWFLVPAGDASGRVCLDTVDTGVACGTPSLIASSGLATSSISQPQSAAGPWVAGGTAVIAGIVPADVTEVVARDARGAVSKRVEVTGQAYELTIATEDLRSLEFRDAAAKVSSAFPIGG